MTATSKSHTYIDLGLKSVEESNLFLRSLWAELRRTFGECKWQYSPHLRKQLKRVALGYVNLGLADANSVEVSVSYEQKGVARGINFQAVSGQFRDDELERIRVAVRRARDSLTRPPMISVRLQLESPYGTMALYRGASYSIFPLNKSVSAIEIQVPSFDQIDARTMVKRTALRMLDFLSVSTNACFSLANGDSANLDPFTQPSPYVEEEDWLDRPPTVNGTMLGLSRRQALFLDRIAAGNIPTQDVFLRACGHFHSASKLHYLGDTSTTTAELANVMFVSALEVATLLDGNSSNTCEKCGQAIFAISSRVRSLARTFAGENVESLVRDYYSGRSKFLHAGILTSDYSYVGPSIPQLDPLSPTGCTSQVSISSQNLLEYTGYILRSVFYTKVDQV